MAKDKESFILYTNIIHTISKLTNEQAGSLFKIILEYVNDKNPIVDDILLQVAFEPIKQKLKEDLKKWESVCNRNRENGSKGGRPKNPEEPKKPTGLSGNPRKPKKPDSDSDSDSDMRWKKDYNIYKQNVLDAFEELKSDNEFVEQQQIYNPNLNIILTIEKAVVNYWATEAGWVNKKKSKAKDSNWKTTFINALSNPTNKVWLPRDANNNYIQYRNDKGELLHKTEWIDNGKRYYGDRNGGKQIQVPMDLPPRPSEQYSLYLDHSGIEPKLIWVIQ